MLRTQTRLTEVSFAAILALCAPGSRAEETSLGSISGRVISAHSENPLPGASVVVRDRGWGAPTNEKGEFRLDRVPPGDYTIRILRVGYERMDLPITVSPGENWLGSIRLRSEPFRILSTPPLMAAPLPRRFVGSRSRVNQDEIQCVVRLLDPEPMVGDRLHLDVRIYNLSRVEAVFPRARGGCDEDLRFPRVRVRVEGPLGGFVVNEHATPGKVQVPRERDFITVKPGKGFELLTNGWSPTKLRLGKLAKPGKYRLVFEYSTREANLDGWFGPDGAPRMSRLPASFADRLQRVALVDLADSVSFVVRP